MPQVKKHNRKAKNKVTTVRKHYRKEVAEFKRLHDINTPIKIKESKNSAGTSEAHTDSVLLDKKPIEHSITLEPSKLAENGTDKKKVLQHELGHVLEREKKILSTKKGKGLIKEAKKTRSFKKLKSKYHKDKEEVFARAYAQLKAGSSKKDVRSGENFTKKEFTKIKKHLK